METYKNYSDILMSPAAKRQFNECGLRNNFIRVMPNASTDNLYPDGFTMRFDKELSADILGNEAGRRISIYETPFSWGDVNAKDQKFLSEFDDIVRAKVTECKVKSDYDNAFRFYLDEFFCDGIRDITMGKLGSNSFIELNRAMTQDAVYLTIYSGPQTIGEDIYREYTKSKNFDSDRNNQYHILNDDKFYLSKYIHDVFLASSWLYWNQVTIIDNILKSFGEEFNAIKMTTWTTYFINAEEKIVRKAALPANKNENVIFPMTARDGFCILKATGNEDWNNCLPLGCGRLVNPPEVDMFEYEDEMDDVYSTTVNQKTLSKNPLVYKDSEQILDLCAANGRNIGVYPAVYSYKE